MTSPAVAEHPAEAVKRWLLEGWQGSLRPSEVIPKRSEDADGREAWYFVVILRDPVAGTWNTKELAELRHGVRDKALEVGLSYPWYLIPRTRSEEPIENEEDLPGDVA